VEAAPGGHQRGRLGAAGRRSHRGVPEQQDRASLERRRRPRHAGYFADQEQLIRDVAAWPGARSWSSSAAHHDGALDRARGRHLMAWYPAWRAPRWRTAVRDATRGPPDPDVAGAGRTSPLREPAGRTQMDFWHGYRHFDKTGVAPSSTSVRPVLHDLLPREPAGPVRNRHGGGPPAAEVDVTTRTRRHRGGAGYVSVPDSRDVAHEGMKGSRASRWPE